MSRNSGATPRTVCHWDIFVGTYEEPEWAYCGLPINHYEEHGDYAYANGEAYQPPKSSPEGIRTTDEECAGAAGAGLDTREKVG